MIPDPYIKNRHGADAVREGYWIVRKRGRVDKPLRIWYGPPLDPVTGEELDRSWRWQATLSGDPIEDLHGIWPECSDMPIDEPEYRYLIARIDHARQYDPHDPYGSASGKVDLRQVRMPF